MWLYPGVFLLLLFSWFMDRERTYKAVKIAAKRFLKILPAFIEMLILVSLVLYLVPDRFIAEYLSSKKIFTATLVASLIGSITFMPGFIVFPLCGILLKKGVPYMVLSAFTTTLMMVGVLTFPVEKSYFGVRVAIVRNLISFLIAMIVAIATGIFFGEVSL